MCFIRNLLLQTDFLVVLNFHMWFFPTVVLTTKPGSCTTTKPRVLYILRTHSATELCWPQPCTWVFILFSSFRICFFYLWGPTVNPSAELSQLPARLALAEGGGHSQLISRISPLAPLQHYLGWEYSSPALRCHFFWILHLFLTVTLLA